VFGGDVGVGECVFVFGDELLVCGFDVFVVFGDGFELVVVYDVCCVLCIYDGDLCGWLGEVDVGVEVFGVYDVVCVVVCFVCDDCDFWDGCFGVCVD